MSVSLVQSKKFTDTAGPHTTRNWTMDANVVVGNVLVLGIGTALKPTSFSISDNLGNTWNTLDETDFGGQASVWTYYAIITVGGSCTITAASTGDSNGAFFTHEVGGVAASPLDQHRAQSQIAPGTGTDAVTSGNVTTTTDGQYIFGIHEDDTVASAHLTHGTGFTNVDMDGGFPYGTQYKIQSAAGIIASTCTTDTGAFAYSAIVTFKAATGGGGTTPMGRLVF